MKLKLLALLLVAGSTVFASPGVFIGVGVGGGFYAPPPPPPVVVAYRPPCPGVGYSWVGGYYVPVGGRYAWHAGYWGRAPYGGARWYGPRYEGHRYYRGGWRR
jgi:hypothetical protein